MKKRPLILFIISFLLVLCSTQIYAQNSRYQWLQELENLVRADQLPTYRPNQLIEQISSYDRTGKNDDGFDGTYSYIRKEGMHLVIADLKGPGVINRIWTPTPNDDTLAFYFDGEKRARLRIRFSDLFSGKVFPFLKGISGNEIGGFYTYMPIPYKKSLKIVLEGDEILFQQVQYRNLPNKEVSSWTGEFSQDEKGKIKQIAQQYAELVPSVEPFAQGRSSNIQITEKTFVLEPGNEEGIFDVQNGGRIVGIEIDGGTAFEGLQKDVLLSAIWDEENIEAIYAPLSDFFGYAYGKKAMRSLLLGTRNQLNYSYLPMPFDRSAELKLIYKKRSQTSQSPISLEVKVYHTPVARIPKSEGKFYAVWRREIPETGKNYQFLKLNGKGHYVGTLQWAQGLRPGMTLFFEGDDRTIIDGEQRLHGTGSEDYYNGGWYALLDRWDRGISLPIHGSLDYSLPMARTGGYRLFMTDKMPFEKEIDHSMEHGPEGNEFPVDYTSIAMFYGAQALTSRQEPTDELREVYIPTLHEYFPQLMEITLGSGAEVKQGRGLQIISDGHHTVRIALSDIPEGTYKLSLSYLENKNGAEFAVWQRQKEISNWRSSKSDHENKVEKKEVGSVQITNQTNSITIHVRKQGEEKGVFELDRIFLEKIDQ
ncbi:MAG: glycoside hydrolase family 172 protein [Sphingobacterium sp.]|uniref:glycoside hydrolase family 172 protein n=1 Tax=Sphingobacterium sp. JB170 TaxID=1434842 RepID=UPI000B34C833|nr:glycoside hydrolase family 172 protein [Sphingobacterium sp. JB170]